jgi:large subunit ribosomal protein L17
MRHKIAHNKLSRKPAHRNLMLRSMVTDLIRLESITTTSARAKEVRRMAEKVITKAKQNTLHNRSQVGSILTDKSLMNKLFTEIAPRYENRPGGYTRITKQSFRKGDAAEISKLELV